MVMPLIALAGGWLLWTGRVGRRGWAAVIALQALLVLSGMIALKSGEQDEDRVEPAVGGGPLHRHEEAAELFVIGSGEVLALSLLGLAPRAVLTRVGALTMAGGTVVVAGLALNVGHAGGQLVYVHGAAAPHVAAAAGGGGAAPTGARASRRSDHE